MKTVDVAALIDGGRFSGYQRLLVAATALMIVLDGADNQLLSNAVPSMMRDGICRARHLPTRRPPRLSA